MLNHLDSKGHVTMVDVSEKEITSREALARGEIKINPTLVKKIQGMEIVKGNVLETARIAGIMAAKKAASIIPLCHPVLLEGIKISFNVQEDRVLIDAFVRSSGKTGVEMEALTAAMVSALTLYDMCKAEDKSMILGPFYLLKKSGGRSGVYVREQAEAES